MAVLVAPVSPGAADDERVSAADGIDVQPRKLGHAVGSRRRERSAEHSRRARQGDRDVPIKVTVQVAELIKRRDLEAKSFDGPRRSKAAAPRLRARLRASGSHRSASRPAT